MMDLCVRVDPLDVASKDNDDEIGKQNLGPWLSFFAYLFIWIPSEFVENLWGKTKKAAPRVMMRK